MQIRFQTCPGRAPQPSLKAAPYNPYITRVGRPERFPLLSHYRTWRVLTGGDGDPPGFNAGTMVWTAGPGLTNARAAAQTSLHAH